MKNIKGIALIVLVSAVGIGITELMSSAFEKELSNRDAEVNHHLEYVKSLN